MRPTDRDRLGQLARDMAEELAPDEFEAVAEFLGAYAAPEPALTRTEALISRLRPFVPPAPARPRFRDEGLTSSPWELAWGCLRSQVRLFRPGWWLGSALAAGAMLALASIYGITPTLVAPPLVAAGVAYAFREAGSATLEIELACPVQPAHVMMARLLVVLGWVSVLGAAATAAVPGSAGGLWPALAGWGAGLLLFGGLALVSLLRAGPWGALGLALMAWVALTAWKLSHGPSLHVWGMTNGAAALLGAALIAVGLAGARRLGALGRKEA